MHARSERLQCEWTCWRVAGEKTLALELANDNCCDMAGAIRQARSLMPEVQTIITISGGKQDTVYRKASGRWAAFSA